MEREGGRGKKRRTVKEMESRREGGRDNRGSEALEVGRVNETKKNEINGMRRQLTEAKERWKMRGE